LEGLENRLHRRVAQRREVAQVGARRCSPDVRVFLGHGNVLDGLHDQAAFGDRRWISSPMMPRRKASTQITKMTPVTVVTDSPSTLKASTPVRPASAVPMSPSLFSSVTISTAPTSGPIKVP